jgi:class 3 adenylate cyclase
VSDQPDDAELERLGLYDPNAPNAKDLVAVLRQVFALGATVEEVTQAAPFRLGDLALDLAMRPPGETLDLDDFVDSCGADALVVRRLWAAFGLPASGPVRVTPDAAGALRLLAGMATWIQPDTVYALARVMGSSSARLAEALISAFRVEVEVPRKSVGATYEGIVNGTVVAGRDLMPPFLEAANAVFRRQMVAISYQLWSTDEERIAVTLDRTVGFADLVSSTEAVRSGSVASLATMVRKFEELVWDLVTTAGGRVVKLIGDEAMFVIEDPARACDVALGLIDTSPHAVRVGLAHGTVVALYGDYYGETVNLAARLVAAAEPSTVAVSDSVRRLAGDAFTFAALPARSLKGFGDPVVFHQASRR